MNWNPQTGCRPETPKPAYTVDEFMTAFGIRRTKTYEEINAGRLKARRAGGRTLIAREDAEAWLASLPIVEARAA